MLANPAWSVEQHVGFKVNNLVMNVLAKTKCAILKKKNVLFINLKGLTLKTEN